MTRTSQIAEELRWARRLLDEIPGCRGWSVCAGVPPEPDVLAFTTDSSVGIELREVVGLAELRQRESEADHVLSRACSILDAQHSERFVLRVYFRPSWAPVKRNREANALSIVSLVREYMPRNDSSTDLGEHARTGMDLDHDFVSYLSVLRVDSLPATESAPLQFWWGSEVSPELIQRNITAKAKKRSQYRGGYSQIWLLLHSYGSTPSSGFDVSSDLKNHRFASNFDRVFLFAGTSPRLIELCIGAPTTDAPSV